MAAMAGDISKDLSYLYERLFSKLSDDGFHDMWSIGGFLVIFIFFTIALTLTLLVVFSWCCSWCVELPERTSTSQVHPLGMATSKQMSTHTHTHMHSPSGHTSLVPVNEPERQLDPAPVPRPEKKSVKSQTRRLKAGLVKTKRKSRPASRVKPVDAPSE